MCCGPRAAAAPFRRADQGSATAGPALAGRLLPTVARVAVLTLEECRDRPCSACRQLPAEQHAPCPTRRRLPACALRGRTQVVDRYPRRPHTRSPPILWLGRVTA